MKWWWALVQTERGPTLVGPYTSDVKAAFEARRLGGSFKLYELDTQDDASAARKVRERRAELVSYRR